MEKIAIFNTEGGSSPLPPVVTGAISIIYGTSAGQTRILDSTRNPSISNLVGGGSEQITTATDGSVQGNVFPCEYNIYSFFCISFGDIQSGGVPVSQIFIDISILEDGNVVESWENTVINANETSNLSFNSLVQFKQDRAYALKIEGITGDTLVEIFGWSVAVQFSSLT
jgi:hypothetical protein